MNIVRKYCDIISIKLPVWLYCILRLCMFNYIYIYIIKRANKLSGYTTVLTLCYVCPKFFTFITPLK